MSKFWSARWDNSQPITLRLFDNGLWPFDVVLAYKQLQHHADFLKFITGRKIYSGGIVTEDTQELGTIYVRYVEQDTVSDGFWAYAKARTEILTPTVINGGLLSFGNLKVDTVEKFAGVFPHELCHSFGMAHWNSGRSIMNNAPYNGHVYQSMYMLEDYRSFMQLFPGGMPLLYPAIYDYGDLSLGKCVIFIPAIEWSPGEYASIYLTGKQENGEWMLEAGASEIREESYAGAPACRLEDDVLTMPIRYMGASVTLRAELIQYSGPSSKVKFKVLSITNSG